MKKIKFCTTFAFLVMMCLTAISQSDWESVGTLYKDSYVKVELQYRLNDPCDINGRSSRFRYFITGSPGGTDKFINWRMDYYNCDKTITCRTNFFNIGKFPSEGINENIDWRFDGYKLEIPFYDVTISSRPEVKASFTKALPVSLPPKSILGSTSIKFGEQTILKVQGGALGSQAEWKWYSENCGVNLVGKGESITVTPVTNTKYFVRAESPNGFTDCVSTYVQVDTRSTDPSLIEGKKIVCRGDKNISLSVSGGSLGLNAEWMWYEDTTKKKLIGKGKTITVSPIQNSIYSVRAEGPSNITNWVSIEMILIDEKLQDPGKIIGNNFVCQGSKLELRLNDNLTSKNSEWVWYAGSVNTGNQVGKGNSMSVIPNVNTTYFVRGEGICGVTKEQTVVVNVGVASNSPNSILVPTHKIFSGKKIQLSVQGGSLGDNAKWTWYKNSCTNGKKIGTGETITTRVRKRTEFSVRAESDCNTTSCATTTINPQTKFTFLNFGIVPSFQSANADLLLDNPTYSLTFGVMKKTGWYVRGKYSIKSESEEYNCNSEGILNYSTNSSYYTFNGEVNYTRISLTAGMIFKLGRSFHLMTGAGYGERELLWGVTEYSNQNNTISNMTWAKNQDASFMGAEFELGIMIKLGGINFITGGNVIIPGQSNGSGNNSYIDSYVGIGFSF